MEPINTKELIPELADWEAHNKCQFEPEDWISCVGNYEHAIGYLSIFWPEMYEYDGCIFVSSLPEKEHYESWLSQTDGNKKSVEAVLNHVHITDLFQVGQLSPTEVQIKYIGSKLREMWHAKAKQQFPNNDIQVGFYEGTSDELREYQVTLFQKWSKS
jgi:hypothetical protein